jgi:hypothetical protein
VLTQPGEVEDHDNTAVIATWAVVLPDMLIVLEFEAAGIGPSAALAATRPVSQRRNFRFGSFPDEDPYSECQVKFELVQFRTDCRRVALHKNRPRLIPDGAVYRVPLLPYASP